jgi:hypothetical protein
VPPPATATPQEVAWNVGTLNPGQASSIQFSLRVTYTAAPPTAITNTVRAGAALAAEVTSQPPLSYPVGACSAVTLSDFTAALQNSGGVKVTWKTAVEANTFGFYVLRSATDNRADAVKVPVEMIPAKGANSSYQLEDKAGSVNTRYWLQEIELDGTQNEHGPIKAVSLVAQPPAQPQPQPQPVVNPVGGVLAVGGGVPVGSLQSPVTQPQGAQPSQPMQAAAQQPQAAQPVQQPAQAAQQPAQPAVASPLNTRNEAAQPVAQPQPAQVQLATQPPAQPAQTQPVAVAEVPQMQQPQAAMPAAQSVNRGLAVGAQEAVGVVRGGVPADVPALTTTAQPASTPANPWVPLAAALTLLGMGVAGAFVVYRRKMRS